MEVAVAWETVVCTRDELYEQVWSAPVRDVAKRYGLSDVGLAKVCSKLAVPIPGRGHWSRIAAGQELEREPLPPPVEGLPLDHEIRRWKQPDDGAPVGDEAKELLAREQEPEMRLIVPEQLRQPHPLVREAAQLLRQKRALADLGRVQKVHACLDIKTSSDTLDRALRIFDTLLKGFEKRGYKIEVSKPAENSSYGRSHTRVCIMNMWIDIALRENASAVKLGSASDSQTAIRRLTLGSSRGVENRPNGKLTLKIVNDHGRGNRQSWGDAKTQRVEDCLDDFMCGLILSAEGKRLEKIEFDRRAQLWREEEQRRQELARLQALEAQRVHDLKSRLADWQRAQTVRQFADAVETRVHTSDRDANTDAEVTRWLAWARNYADDLEADAVDVLDLRPMPQEQTRRFW